MLNEAAAAMTALGAPRYALVARIDAASGPVRVWTGVGDLPIEPDDVDEDGGTYQGIGTLGDIPALRQLVGGTAERVEFTLTDPAGAFFDLVDADAAEIIRAQVNLGIVFFDDAWQMAAPPAWLWDGTADAPAINRGVGDVVQRAVSMSVASAFTDRTRPEFIYFTDAEQRRRSPDDRFCERVSLYTAASTVKWPA